MIWKQRQLVAKVKLTCYEQFSRQGRRIDCVVDSTLGGTVKTTTDRVGCMFMFISRVSAIIAYSAYNHNQAYWSPTNTNTSRAYWSCGRRATLSRGSDCDAVWFCPRNMKTPLWLKLSGSIKCDITLNSSWHHSRAYVTTQFLVTILALIWIWIYVGRRIMKDCLCGLVSASAVL